MPDDFGGGGEPVEVSPALFTLFPATKHHGLIVRYPFEDDSRLSCQFAQAAARLATTYVGDPRDDDSTPSTGHLRTWRSLRQCGLALTPFFRQVQRSEPLRNTRICSGRGRTFSKAFHR
jgi:hypothetical protein